MLDMRPMRPPKVLSSRLDHSPARCLTLLWTLLAAFGPIGAPVLHSFEDGHAVARSHAAHPLVAEANGGVHDRGCPDVPPASHDDGGACLTCRTLQHSKASIAVVNARPVAISRPQLYGYDDRPASVWVDLPGPIPRGPPATTAPFSI